MPYPCENGCNGCDDCTDWEDNDTTSAAQSLAPCPFCGAPASGYAIEAHEHSSPLKALGIPDHAGSYVIEGDCQCGSGLIGETQEEVTARWNRRAQPTPPAVVEPLTVEQVHKRNPYKHSRGAASIWLSGFRAAELWYRIKGDSHG